MTIMVEGASADPKPSSVTEPKCSFVQTFSRLFPYWFTVANFVLAIALAHAWNSDKGYEGFQALVVDPVRTAILFDFRQVLRRLNVTLLGPFML
jgi:hypothetical protein